MEKFEIGKILKPQGIKGEFKVQLIVEPHFLDGINEVYFDNSLKSYKILSKSFRQGFLYLIISEYEDRNSVETLKYKSLFVDKELVVNNKDDDEFFIEELIGFKVETTNGKYLGILKEINNYGSADVYTIENGENEILFPNVKDIIINIDTNSKIIILDESIFDEVAVYED